MHGHAWLLVDDKHGFVFEENVEGDVFRLRNCGVRNRRRWLDADAVADMNALAFLGLAAVYGDEASRDKPLNELARVLELSRQVDVEALALLVLADDQALCLRHGPAFDAS
jgi:hypothetical protein